MNLDRENLVSLLSTVLNATASKNTLPILCNVLMESDGNDVTVSGTNMDMAIRCTCPQEGLEPFQITVPAKRFYRTINEMEGDSVSLYISEENSTEVRLESKNSKAVFNTVSAKDFPPIRYFDNSQWISFPRAKLKSIISKVIFAVSKDESRYTLNGVYMKTDETSLDVVATDGRRLSLYTDKEVQISKQADAIISFKVMQELLKLLSVDVDNDSPVVIHKEENQVCISLQIENKLVTIFGRLIEGRFPNYRSTIPRDCDIKTQFNVKDILSSLKRNTIFCEEDHSVVTMGLENGKAVFSSKLQNLGYSEEKVLVQYTGKDFSISFKPTFLLDIMRNQNPSNVVEMCFSSSLSPFLVLFTADSGHVSVIMPIRVN